MDKQQRIKENESKTKLTYITPVLDFVQAESEGLLGGRNVSGIASGGDGEYGGGDSGGEAKDFYFQFEDSDADFFYLD